jgi:hypothetical protein
MKLGEMLIIQLRKLLSPVYFQKLRKLGYKNHNFVILYGYETCPLLALYFKDNEV